jgi:hypothetical protein
MESTRNDSFHMRKFGILKRKMFVPSATSCVYNVLILLIDGCPTQADAGLYIPQENSCDAVGSETKFWPIHNPKLIVVSEILPLKNECGGNSNLKESNEVSPIKNTAITAYLNIPA